MTSALIAIALLIVAVEAVVWRVRRSWRAERSESARARIIREALERADLAAEVDDLELLWSLPAYQRPDPDLDAGCDRLWNAIRDHREEEEA